MSAAADLRGLVKAAYENALRNEYTFEGWPLEDIADDMLAHDADIERINPAPAEIVAALREVVPAIEAARKTAKEEISK